MVGDTLNVGVMLKLGLRVGVAVTLGVAE